MDKTTLKFKADEQKLTGGQALFASDTINYIEAEFELGENWSGYDSVRAVWHTNHDSISTVLNEFGHCVVPQEVLRREGKVEVNLVGSIASGDVLTDRLTTYPIVAIVVDAKAKLYSTETSPITPSQFEQFALTSSMTMRHPLPRPHRKPQLLRQMHLHLRQERVALMPMLHAEQTRHTTMPTLRREQKRPLSLQGILLRAIVTVR